jgi:hypothetical protein
LKENMKLEEFIFRFFDISRFYGNFIFEKINNYLSINEIKISRSTNNLTVTNLIH